MHKELVKQTHCDVHYQRRTPRVACSRTLATNRRSSAVANQSHWRSLTYLRSKDFFCIAPTALNQHNWYKVFWIQNRPPTELESDWTRFFPLATIMIESLPDFGRWSITGWILHTLDLHCHLTGWKSCWVAFETRFCGQNFWLKSFKSQKHQRNLPISSSLKKGARKYFLNQVALKESVQCLCSKKNLTSHHQPNG